MKGHDVFWKLEALSDRQLLERMGSMLGSSRRLMAELIAHLGEVEERRLHLAAACSSMFAYCLKLGMSEDEAYRRIEVARMARRYPAIFPSLANGQLSISVVALLKHHLSQENHLDLFAAVSSKSVNEARALLAARFPRPEVASSVRKLPERRGGVPSPPNGVESTEETAREAVSSAQSTAAHSARAPASIAPVTWAMGASAAAGSSSSAAAVSTASAAATSMPAVLNPPLAQEPAQQPRSRIEPLSAQRYKVQLTASVELARKLELARDLMRHANPTGELGPIVERALDLLIEKVMKQRFGATARRKVSSAEDSATRERDTTRASAIVDGAAVVSASNRRSPTDDTAAAVPAMATAPEVNQTAPRRGVTFAREPGGIDSVAIHDDAATTIDPACGSSSARVPRATRRSVLERDGLGCSWVGDDGARCGSRAWLEHDHRRPRAKGGGSDPGNVRLLCRNHNRLAAEREYGRQHVDQAISARRRERSRPSPAM